jgi:hypothetical protein
MKEAMMTEVTQVLLLSKSCGHCKNVLNKHINKILSSNVKMLFIEDDESSFMEYMNLVKPKIEEVFPEIKNHQYVTPVLLFVDNEKNVVHYLLGFTQIDSYFDSLSV